MTQILWFRRDLRASNNPLLETSGEVLPIFIFDKNILSRLDGSDERVWHILNLVLDLKAKLKSQKLDLAIFYGEPIEIFSYLKTKANFSITASIDYDSYATARDVKVGQIFNFKKLTSEYLTDFDKVLTNSGTPYNVFTSFYKKAMLGNIFSIDYKNSFANKTLFNFDYDGLICIENGMVVKKDIYIENLGFKKSNIQIPSLQILLDGFSKKNNSYEANRDFLELNATSSLGFYIRFGAIDIRVLANMFKENATFVKQLIWRDFFAYIFYHYPKSEIDNFLDLKVGWENNEEKLFAWQNGKTGVPIVDAAMSELNTTGNMHNRARMIVASFLTKDLHIDWKFGERYFAKKLFDYDAASNVGSWQWCASTGVDAQPYFRVFNPYLQAQKFDENCEYIKKYLPELKNINSKILLNEDLLFKTDIANYPKPIVRHKAESAKAIAMFKGVKNSEPNLFTM